MCGASGGTPMGGSPSGDGQRGEYGWRGRGEGAARADIIRVVREVMVDKSLSRVA